MKDLPSKTIAGWTESKIEELFLPLEDGRTLHQGWSPRCETVPSTSSNEWGVLKTTAIQAGLFLPEHNKLLPPALSPRPLLEVKTGDMLITCAGPRVRCGVACLVRGTRKRLMISGKMYRFRTRPDRIDPRYMEAYLQSPKAQALIDRMKTGGNESGLNLTHDRFKRLVVPVTPLEEQVRIVAEIEKQFSRLDEAVASLRRVKANLKRYRAAVLKAAVEGKLTEEWRTQHPDVEPASKLLERILAERRARWNRRGKYKEPDGPDTNNLPGLPRGWVWATADQLTDETRAITYGVIKLGPHMTDGIPVLRSSDVRSLHLDLQGVKRVAPGIAGQFKRTFLHGNEILVTVRGTLGGVVVAPHQCSGFNISREVAMLALVDEEIAKAMAIFIASGPIQRWLMQRTKGIAYTGINIETLKKLPLPLPSIAEQQQVVAEVERRLSVIEGLETTVEANLTRADRLRQSTLRDAFTGNLVPQRVQRISPANYGTDTARLANQRDHMR